jgi:hypothetical protein
MAGGRWRPTVHAASTKMVACNEIASTGVSASGRSRVRHSRMTATSTHTPMTFSVLPKRDHTSLTPFHSSVRLRLRSADHRSSRWSRPTNGPVTRNPRPMTTA